MSQPDTTRSSHEWRWESDEDVPITELMRRLTWDLERKIDAALQRKETNNG